MEDPDTESPWDGAMDSVGHCESCRRGDFVTCRYAQSPGFTYDGGYAEYMIAPTEALASIPNELSGILMMISAYY